MLLPVEHLPAFVTGFKTFHAPAKQQLSVFPRLAMAMQRPLLRKQLSKHYPSIHPFKARGYMCIAFKAKDDCDSKVKKKLNAERSFWKHF